MLWQLVVVASVAIVTKLYRGILVLVAVLQMLMVVVLVWWYVVGLAVFFRGWKLGVWLGLVACVHEEGTHDGRGQVAHHSPTVRTPANMAAIRP